MHMADSNRDERTMDPLASTAVLLKNDDWRVRLVEKVRPLTKDHYELRRSYQFRMPIDAFYGLSGADGSVDTFLPVCWLDKHPLLQFDVTDQSGTPRSVLERVSNAGVTAAILDDWIADLAPTDGFDDSDFLEEVCYTSLGPWQQAADRTENQDESLALYRYYVDLLGIRLPPFECDRLAEDARLTISEVLAAIGLNSRDDAFASTLNPTILAPFTSRIGSQDELLGEVARINDRVRAITDLAATSTEAASWVRLLHRSSRQWPVLTRTTVRPGSEVLIKTREVRPSGDVRAARVIHRADLGGAMSYHLEVQAPDPSIRLSNQPRIEDLDEHELGVPGGFDTVKWTNELFSAYSTSIDRPERPETAVVTMRFGLYATTWVPEVFAFLLNSLALGFALSHYNTMSIDLAAMLLIPTTVASAFFSIRDSTLVSHLLRPFKWAQLAMNLLLWMTVLVLVDVPGLGK